MSNKASALAALSAAVLLTAGCIEGTSAQRSASFAPYAATAIGGEPLPKFLAARTALLFTADRPSVAANPDQKGEFTLKGSGSMAFGVATAIDSRGYFLTAAHCLGEHALYLFIGSGAGMRAEPATVIWRGDLSKHEPDLALLRVGQPLRRVFDWGAEGKGGDRVFAIGPDFDQPTEVAAACMSGVILPPSETSTTSPASSSINHTAPLHQGDSGGPLIDTAGRLLGINVSGNLDLYFVSMGRLTHSEAVRPDVGWLNDLISADAAKRR